jgi:thioredoxin
MATQKATDSTFEEEVLKSDTPVLVDFWAEWCGPCKALGPIIDELATMYQGRVKVGKLDTDANRQVSTQYAITAIPTVILFQGGQIKEKFVGLRSKKDLSRSLDGVAAPA